MRDWNRCHKCGVMTSQEYKVVRTETVVRPCCEECAKPEPARLSAEMLGEEAIGHLRLLREGLDEHWITFTEHQAAIAFLDRLLKQGEG